MQTTLKIKDIDLITYDLIEFICIFVYFSDTTKNEMTILTFIIKKIHFVDDLKVKMLIENDFLDFEESVINIKEKIMTIDNCKINISLKLQSKNSYIRKTIPAQNIIILQLNEKQFISIRIKIFENRDFFSN